MATSKTASKAAKAAIAAAIAETATEGIVVDDWTFVDAAEAPEQREGLTTTELATRYATIVEAVEATDAGAKWEWSRQLDEHLTNLATKRDRSVVSKQIGIEIAKLIGRDKPYSGVWVRMHCSAYHKFPEKPSDNLSCRKFMAAAYGNYARLFPDDNTTEEVDAEVTPTEEGAGTSGGRKPQDPSRKLTTAVEYAVGKGLTSNQIRAIVEALI